MQKFPKISKIFFRRDIFRKFLSKFVKICQIFQNFGNFCQKVLIPGISQRHLEYVFTIHARIQPVNCTLRRSSPGSFPEPPQISGRCKISAGTFFQKCCHNPLTKLSKNFLKLFIKKFYKKKIIKKFYKKIL